ncbi:MAG: WG repeat-containing protein [Candidatus Kapaibacterium sp.]
MLRFILPAVLISLSTLHAQSLLPIVEGDHYGFIDLEGRVVIPPHFKSVGSFSEGFAPARLDGLYGYIDTAGNYQIEPRFDYAEPFHNGIAQVSIDGKPRIIDLSGTVLFDHNFTEIGEFIDGYAVVKTADEKEGVVNLSGKLILDTIYRSVSSHSDGVFVVKDSSEVGVIDVKGRIVVPFGKYESIQPFGCGHAWVRRKAENGGDGNAGIINTWGEEVKFYDDGSVMPDDYRSTFSDGLSIVEINRSHYGIVDTTGALSLPKSTVKEILPFSNGRTFAQLRPGEWILIDRNGKRYNDTPYRSIAKNYFEGNYACVEIEEGWIIIDRKGKRISGSKEIDADVVMLQKNTVVFLSYSKGMFGFWDISTDTLVPPQFRSLELTATVPQRLFVVDEGRMAYWTLDGERLWQQDQSKSRPTLNIDYMLRGYCYAASAPQAKYAGYGGWAESQLLYKAIEEDQFSPDGFSVTVVQSDTAQFAGEYPGMILYVVNRTSDTVVFQAQDSRLYLKLQARDMRGEWRDIEYLPSSWCGNSYHYLYLPPETYWNFTIPEYSGAFKTLLRAELTYFEVDTADESNNSDEFYWMSLRGNEVIIYSNEFEGSINPAQFWRKREYYPRGLMDPYND